MILQKEKLRIVPATSDYTEISKILTSQSIIDNLSETRLYSEGIKMSLVFRIEVGEQVIGEISLKSIRWYNRKAEISIFVSKDNQQKGYGKQALQLFINYFFNTMNMHRLEAEIYEYNKKSQQLFESFGFILEGKLREAKYFNGKYYDILRYGLLRKELDFKKGVGAK
jgi:RimJ/RimL family protein N-acetyltransferase